MMDELIASMVNRSDREGYKRIDENYDRFVENSDSNANTGIKFDTGKPRCGLVINGFSRAMMDVCRVGTMGAEKYAPDNWQKLENGLERYTDAMYRHLLEESSGELYDRESGLLHASHAAWNALARLEFLLRSLDES